MYLACMECRQETKLYMKISNTSPSKDGIRKVKGLNVNHMAAGEREYIFPARPDGAFVLFNYNEVR